MLLVLQRFAQRGSRQESRRIQRGQGRCLGHYQQRNFCTAEDYGVAAFIFQSPNHLDEVGQGLRQKLRVDQFIENDLIDVRALLERGKS